MIKKLRSYRKIFTRDFTQKLYISRFKGYENDNCENEIYYNYINIKNYSSSFNSLTNETIFELIIRASRVNGKSSKRTLRSHRIYRIIFE